MKPTYYETTEEGYAVDVHGLITDPGKFEREPGWVPHLWNLGLEGWGEFGDGSEIKFTLPKGDPLRVKFPHLDEWLGRRRVLILWEDDNGFVYATTRR